MSPLKHDLASYHKMYTKGAIIWRIMKNTCRPFVESKRFLFREKCQRHNALEDEKIDLIEHRNKLIGSRTSILIFIINIGLAAESDILFYLR